MQQVTGELKSAAEACTVTIITKPTKGDQLFRLGTVGMSYFADDVIQATICNDIGRIRICIFNNRNISWNIFFQSLKVSFDFFLSRLHKCQQLRPSLFHFTVNFIRIFWGRWSIATIEAIFSEGFVIPRMMPSSLSALQHHIHSTQDADTFSTLFGCVQFSVLSHDKRIGLTKFNYFESISSRCRLSNVSGDNCVGVALSPPRSPQKWKNVRGEAKLGCGGATAPHAYFKPWRLDLLYHFQNKVQPAYT